MINHTVLYKLREFENEDLKSVVRTKIRQALLALKEKIDVIRHIEVGLNHELNTASYDICLVTHFESLNDLEIYRVDPEHQKVFELIRANVADRAVIDFEF